MFPVNGILFSFCEFYIEATLKIWPSVVCGVVNNPRKYKRAIFPVHLEIFYKLLQTWRWYLTLLYSPDYRYQGNEKSILAIGNPPEIEESLHFDTLPLHLCKAFPLFYPEFFIIFNNFHFSYDKTVSCSLSAKIINQRDFYFSFFFVVNKELKNGKISCDTLAYLTRALLNCK